MYNLINVYKNILQVYVMDLMVPPVWKYIIWYLLNTVRQHFHLLRFYLRYFQIYLCVAPLSSFKICFCRSKNVAPCIHEEPSTDQDHEGISRCKVPQMVSTARADLEDKDTCLFRYSPLSSACSGGLHHRREDVKMHRGILSVTVPFHSISCTACSCGYAMQDFAAPGRVKCMHIW